MKEKKVKIILFLILVFMTLLGTLVFKLSSNVSLDHWTIISFQKSKVCMIFSQKFEIIKESETKINYRERKYKKYRTLEVLEGHVNRKFRELDIDGIKAVYSETRTETTIHYKLEGEYYLQDSLVRRPNVMAQKDCDKWLKKIKKKVLINY